MELALAELDAVLVEACWPRQHQNRVVANHPRGWEKVAQVFVAETGADMSRDTAVAHLAAWTGLVPAMNESASKQSPAGKRHGNKC